MNLQEKTASKKAPEIRVDAGLDNLDSGLIGAVKKEKLAKHKYAILAAVEKHRAKEKNAGK